VLAGALAAGGAICAWWLVKAEADVKKLKIVSTTISRSQPKILFGLSDR
jgi:hypothetical protein